MTEQYRLKDPRPYRHRIFEVSSLGSGLVLLILIIFLFGLLLRSDPETEAKGAMIGTEPDCNGHILKDTRLVPVDTRKICLQFYLHPQAGGNTPLEFRWYAGEQLAAPSSSGVYEEGYVTAYLELDSINSDSFPAGIYHVEVWAGETMILYKPFTIH